MKRSTFITLFITTHIAFIFLQVQKHSQFIKQSFSKQKNERQLASLEVKKQQLMQELYTAKNHTTVKEFATTQLKMIPVRLSQIKKVNRHDPSV